jgi:hypothetical protein
MTSADQIIFDQWKAAKPMARALRSVADLNSQKQIAIALKHAGFGPLEIDAHLLDALEIEKDRRVIAGICGDVAELVCLIALLVGIVAWCIPNTAYAADVQPMPTSHEWATIVGIGGLVLWFAFLSYCAIYPPQAHRTDDPDTRPHGDTTGLR